MSENELVSSRRQVRLVWARFVAIWLARREGWSCHAIGKVFGDRDHSTVMHAVAKVDERLRTDPEFANGVTELAARADAHAAEVRKRRSA